jgi:hypothetical protein
MNYLTHYYVNTLRPEYTAPSPDFHFGAALPDILSVYDRNLRFHPSVIESGQNDLWKGIQNHLQMDTFFHRSDFFKKSYEEIRNHLTRVLSPELNIRPFFLAHVMAEILLDHYLLKRSPDLARRFYEQLTGPDVKNIIRILEEHFNSKLEGLAELINKFLVTRFLEGYIELENLIYPVNRMLTRTRQQAINIQGIAVTKEILQPSLGIVSENFPLLIHQFNKEFLNA